MNSSKSPKAASKAADHAAASKTPAQQSTVQRLATAVHSVATTSPGLLNFWRANGLQNPNNAVVSPLAVSTPSAELMGADVEGPVPTNQPGLMVNPTGQTNRSPSVSVDTSAAEGTISGAGRPPTLDVNCFTDYSTLDDVEGVAENGPAVIVPPHEASQSANKVPAKSNADDVPERSPLFELIDGGGQAGVSALARPTPLTMSDADLSVFTEPDLHPKSYEGGALDGYQRDSVVSSVSDETEDVALLRAIQNSGGQIASLDPFVEKASMAAQAAALESYKTQHQQTQEAFKLPPDDTAPVKVVNVDDESLQSQVTALSNLLTRVLQSNDAMAKEVAALKAAKTAGTAGNIDISKSVGGDEDVGSYDRLDPWLVEPSTATDSAHGGPNGEVKSAPARLQTGDHGSQSMEGWSGLSRATWMDAASAPPHVPPSLFEGETADMHEAPEDRAVPVPATTKVPVVPPTPAVPVVHTTPVSAPAVVSWVPTPTSSSAHQFKQDDVVLDCFVSDDEARRKPPNKPSNISDPNYGILYPKDQRIPPGMYGHAEQQKVLTYKLPTQTFGVHEANVTEKTDKGNISEGSSIVTQFDLWYGQLRNSEIHLLQRDLLSITYVPKPRDGVRLDIPIEELQFVTRHEIFENGGAVLISITRNWADLKLEWVVLWQRMINAMNVNLSQYEQQSSRLLYEIIRRSCTTDFWDEIMRVKKASGLDGHSWGGVVVLYLCITTLFHAPEHVLQALRSDIDTHELTGLTKTEGENVKVVTKHLGWIVRALLQGRGLQTEHVGKIVRGFINSSNDAFRDYFVMEQRKEVQYQMDLKMNRSLVLVKSQQAIYDDIKLHLDSADSLYEALVDQRLWLTATGSSAILFNKAAPSTPRSLPPGAVCDNCLATDHILPDCPKDRNPDEIKKNRAARLAKNSGDEKEKKVLPTRDANGNSKAQIIHREPRVNARTGQVEVYCGKCEKYTNHTTKFHTQAQEPSFNLSDMGANHPAVQLQTALQTASQAAAATPAPAAAAPAPSAPGGRTLTAQQLTAFTTKQASLVEAIGRNGAESVLGREAKAQFDQLTKDLESHFQ